MNGRWIIENLESRFWSNAEEPDRHTVLAYSKVRDRDLRKPLGESWIKPEFVSGHVGADTKYGAQKHEDGTRSPRLGYIRADVLHGKAARRAFQTGE